MENEAFVDQDMDQNGVKRNENPKKSKTSKKQRSKKVYSVKLVENNVELSALSKALPNFNTGDGNDEANPSIGAAVRQGRRSVITKEIEKSKRNSSLDKLDDVGFSALHHVTRYCRIDAIEDLLKSGANINLQSRDDDFTALHIAARFGWYDAMKTLLKYGADATLSSKTGATALHLVCIRGCPITAELIIKQKGVDINAKDNLLRTPLHIAASHGHYELIMKLLDYGADVFAVAADKTSCLYMCMMNNRGSRFPNKATMRIVEKVFEKAPERYFASNASEIEGFSLTHIVAVANAIEVMKMIFDRGGDINVANVLNGVTPIHIACRKGNLEMVELLVQQGADVHAKDLQGHTPLHDAAGYGHNDLITFLIDKGAQVDARDSKNMTPFLLASSKPKAKPSTIQLLLEAGADVNASEAFMKNCIHLAVESENHELIQLFLGNEKAVLNLYSPDVSERVALHYAAKSGSLKVLKLLLTKQQALNMQDDDQKTAIHLAARANRMEHVTALGQAGASVNQRDDEGRTALHAAASRFENRKICKALVSLGADVNSKDTRDRTPLMLAAELGCVKTVKTMLNLNARIDDASVDGDTALLAAVRGNKNDVVQLLMDRNVKVTHRDHTGAGVFETAVKSDAKESVNVICSHERCREIINNTANCQGQRPMEILIQHFPEAAEIVMSKCITRSTDILQSHEDYTVGYNFELLDPGPDDPSALAGNRYFGPKTMVKHMRQDLLLHPLTQKLLDIKWYSFGSKVY